MGGYWWLETEYIYGDFSEKKWALHKVAPNEDGEEVDDIILWKAYSDTPDYPHSDEDIDGGWAAIDKCIESELGFLPEYDVN